MLFFMSSFRWASRVVIGFLFVALLCACGASNSGTSEQTQSAEALNGRLTGNLWVADTGSYFNFSTGQVTKLSDYKIFPSLDGREYVELIEDFREQTDAGCDGNVGDVDLINILRTNDGALLASFEKLLTITSPVIMSPDRQSLAAFTVNSEVCDSEFFSRLTVFSRDGEQIIQSNRGIVSFDWLPDNRLVFFVEEGDQYLMGVETTRHSLNYSVVAVFRDSGRPSRIDVSPKGDTVLIEMVTGTDSFLSGINYREASIFKINIDGTNLQRIVGTSREESPRVNQPTWSPDGNQFVVTENYTSGAQASFYGWDDVTTIVADVSTIPVNRENVSYVLPASTPFVALPPVSFSAEVRPIIGLDEDGTLAVMGFKPLRHQAWTIDD